MTFVCYTIATTGLVNSTFTYLSRNEYSQVKCLHKSTIVLPHNVFLHIHRVKQRCQPTQKGVGIILQMLAIGRKQAAQMEHRKCNAVKSFKALDARCTPRLRSSASKWVCGKRCPSLPLLSPPCLPWQAGRQPGREYQMAAVQSRGTARGDWLAGKLDCSQYKA